MAQLQAVICSVLDLLAKDGGVWVYYSADQEHTHALTRTLANLQAIHHVIGGLWSVEALLLVSSYSYSKLQFSFDIGYLFDTITALYSSGLREGVEWFPQQWVFRHARRPQRSCGAAGA